MAILIKNEHYMKWKEIKEATLSCPSPRHGHRCVTYGKYLIMIGGGNDGMMADVSIFNTVSNRWYSPAGPSMNFPGCAAYGIAIISHNIYIFGGIYEKGLYSNDLYKINVLDWSCTLCLTKIEEGSTRPQPRLGHSFNLSENNNIYMFGGLGPDPKSAVSSVTTYYNDLYILKIDGDTFTWSKLSTTGTPPSPRESHTGLIHKIHGNETLIIYGGMSGYRNGDIHFLDINTLHWSQPVILGQAPPPRSLHVAGVCNNKMIIFGGWIPANEKKPVNPTQYSEKDWKCTNDVASFNLETLTWEKITINEPEESLPKARAGHCGVVFNDRLYIWSGRDAYKKSWSDQVCCKDFWYLEISKALPPGKIYMDGNDAKSVTVKWDPICNADYYIVQVMKVGKNTVCNSKDVKNMIEKNIKNLKLENAQSQPIASKQLPPLKPVTPPPKYEAIKERQYTDYKHEITSGLKRKTPSEIEHVRLEVSDNQVSNFTRLIDQTASEIANTYTYPKNSCQSQVSHSPELSAVKPEVDHNELQKQPCDLLDNKPESTQDDKNKCSMQTSINMIQVVKKVKLSELPITPGVKYDKIIAPLNKSLPPLGVQLNRELEMKMKMPPVSKALQFNDIPLGQWFESAIVSEPRVCVSQFFYEMCHEKMINRTSINRKSINLEANFTYRLRIASVNSCGIGMFSSHLSFSTTAPGLPGPPTNVRVIKKQDEIFLSWEPTDKSTEQEYFVYLSKPLSCDLQIPANFSHFKYIYDKIYQGRECKCSLLSYFDSASMLGQAENPYQMLRIVAKNFKGYGPVTQIKWFRNVGSHLSGQRLSEKFPLQLRRLRTR